MIGQFENEKKTTKKRIDNTTGVWWLRSAEIRKSCSFAAYCGYEGYISYDFCSDICDIVPFFMI